MRPVWIWHPDSGTGTVNRLVVQISDQLLSILPELFPGC